MDNIVKESINPSQKVVANKVYVLLRNLINNCKDPYAVQYAKSAISNGMIGYTLKVQVDYVLANTAHWRGPQARECKEELRRWSARLG